MSDLTAGALLGRYRIERELGRGGMGIVFRAVDTELGRPVALKIINPQLTDELGFRDRFARESRLAASIDHPNIVPVYEAGEADGRVFLAMRMVDGEDLARIVDREHGLDPARAVRIVRQVGAALDAAHRVGLVHRDVKPGNVLVVGEGEDEHAYLTDFGLAKSEWSAGLTMTGILVGTPAYMAPEQVDGEPAGPPADLYALGCLLFEALTGRPPFVVESDIGVLMAHLNEEAPAPSTVKAGLPPALDAVLATALQKDPAARYASAADLVRAAQGALGAPVPAPSATKRRTAARTPSRRRRLALAIAFPAVLVAGLVAAVLAAVDGDDAAPDATSRVSPVATGAAPPARPGANGELRVADVVEVGGSPDGLTVDGDGVFVADGRGRLVRIDARTAAITDEIRLRGGPDSVSGQKGILWVSLERTDAVARVDVRGDKPLVLKTVDVGGAPEGLSLGEQVLWVANREDSTVTRIDRATTSVLTPTISGIGDGPIGIFVGPSAVWVAGAASGTVARIDASSAELIGAPVKVGDDARDVVEGEGGVWVTLPEEDAVVRLDPASGRPVGRPIPVGDQPNKVTVGGGSVWVTNFGDGTVSRIDPKAGRTVGTAVVTGSRPVGIAVGGGSVWVANSREGTVARIPLP